MRAIGELVGAVMADLLRATVGSRRTISMDTRFYVMWRDNGLCRYCGGSADRAQRWNSMLERYVRTGELDHVLPVIQGGYGTVGNLVLACFWCNQRKKGRGPTEAGMRLLPVSEAT